VISIANEMPGPSIRLSAPGMMTCRLADVPGRVSAMVITAITDQRRREVEKGRTFSFLPLRPCRPKFEQMGWTAPDGINVPNCGS